MPDGSPKRPRDAGDPAAKARGAGRNGLDTALFDSAPIGLTLFDGDLNFIGCNDAVPAMHGVTKEHYLANFHELSPEYQPDGSKSREKALEIMKRVLGGEKVAMEWMHSTPTGESIPCEITGTRMKHEGGYIGLGYVYDLRRIRKMEEIIRLLESEAMKAYFDPLTGIHNRRYFDEHLNRLMKTLARSGGLLSLIMIDIDHFKEFNDTYGHSAGDGCLKAVAETISKSFTRADDFAARYGGEEFAVVLPNTHESGARLIAERLLENIRKRNIPHEKSRSADRVTISVGVATGKAENAKDADDYIKRADEMLYKSKHEGRDRYSSVSF